MLAEVSHSMNQLLEARKRLHKIGGFYSSKWNFIKRLETIAFGHPESCLFFGSGAFIHTFNEDQGAANNAHFDLESRLCVFEATGTSVQGVEYLHNHYWLAWGGSYIVIFSIQKLCIGGSLCQDDVLSTGKQIVTVKVFDNTPSPTVFEIYFIDGTMREVLYRGVGVNLNERMKLSRKPALTLFNTYRLPLRTGEMITTGYTGSFGTQLGTSHGRIISIKDSRVQIASEPILKAAVKQIVKPSGKDYADVPTLILFENGSIVSWKKDKKFVELKGRYTSISEFIFTLADDVNQGEKYILAGDMDGTVTIIRVDSDVLQILRVFRNRTFGGITAMILLNDYIAILSTNTGELQMFDMTELYRDRSYISVLNKTMIVFKNEDDPPPPPCVVDSDYYYKFTNGWYFVKDDEFCKAFKGTVRKEKKPVKAKQEFVALFNGKKLKMKYLVCTSNTDREIAIAYTGCEFFCFITDYSSKKPRVMEHTGREFRSRDGKSLRILQVIPMKSHILVQCDYGIVQLLFIDMTHTKMASTPVRKPISTRITAAACIENGYQKDAASRFSALMLTYVDGTAEVASMEWLKDGSLNLQHLFPYVADLQGSYFVSAIASLKHLGVTQCLLLSEKGILYLAASGLLFGGAEQLYATVFQRDVRGMLGRGHSLHETSFGILAAGFKQHTLHVCRVAMKISQIDDYIAHLFSVDTRSSRLPFTIIEEKKSAGRQGERKTNHQITVSYYDPDSLVTEDRFSCYNEKLPYINGTRHMGIIKNCHVSYGFDAKEEYFDTFISGDTKGNFCFWTNRHNEAKVENIVAVKTVAKFPVAIKAATCNYANRVYYLTALGVDGILRRAELSSKPTTIEMKWKISAMKMFVGHEKRNSTYVSIPFLLVGDPQGWVYVMVVAQQRESTFHIDQLHKNEIIDVTLHTASEKEWFLFSLDITGTVIIRKLLVDLQKPENRPIIWHTAIPSAQKIIRREGKREIMVIGKGVATRNY